MAKRTVVDSVDQPTILWCGRFSKNDGYGTATRSHLGGLTSIGAKVAAFDLDLLDFVGPESGARMSLAVSGGQAVITSHDPQERVVVVYHERPDLYQRIRAEGRTRLIGHSVFETDGLPPGWLDKLVSMDEIWVPSDYNLDGFASAGVPEFLLRKVPHSLDSSAYAGKLGRLRFHDDSTCVFLTVCSGLERRDLGLCFRSFLRAFDATSDVAYVVKVRPDDATLRSVEGLLERSVRTVGGDAALVAANVKIIASDFESEEMIRLYSGCDVYLSPERANGWDLPTMEAMASGKLTIGAHTGGSTDYTNDDVALRIPVVHDAPSPISAHHAHRFYTAQTWPGVDESAFVDAIRRAGSDAELRAQLGSRAQSLVGEKFDVSVVARGIVDVLASLGPTDFRSNDRARVIVNRRSAWRSVDVEGRDINETMIRSSLRQALSTPMDGSSTRARYSEAMSLRNGPPTGRIGPIEVKLGRMVSVPRSKPVRKALRTADLARKLLQESIRRDARQEQTVVQGLRSIRSAEYDASPIDEAELAARRAAFGRFPVIPLAAEDRSRLQSLRDVYRNERCFILGNGPSLNRTDLSKLANEFTFGVNKIYLLFDRIEWRPTFYSLLDWRVGPEIAPFMDELDESVKFLPNRFRGVLEPDERSYWYTTRPVLDHIDDQFAPDIVNGVPSRGTILVTAIQIAFYLGFRDIYLIGADASYSIPETVKQSGPDRFGTGVRLNLESTQDDDPNHFDPTYFGKGALWHDPNVDEMVRMFRTMRKGVEYNGGRLWNATVGGQLEVLDRVNFDSLFD